MAYGQGFANLFKGIGDTVENAVKNFQNNDPNAGLILGKETTVTAIDGVIGFKTPAAAPQQQPQQQQG